jgi:hypothetical protein
MYILTYLESPLGAPSIIGKLDRGVVGLEVMGQLLDQFAIEEQMVVPVILLRKTWFAIITA